MRKAKLIKAHKFGKIKLPMGTNLFIVAEVANQATFEVKLSPEANTSFMILKEWIATLSVEDSIPIREDAIDDSNLVQGVLL